MYKPPKQSSILLTIGTSPVINCESSFKCYKTELLGWLKIYQNVYPAIINTVSIDLISVRHQPSAFIPTGIPSCGDARVTVSSARRGDGCASGHSCSGLPPPPPTTTGSPPTKPSRSSAALFTTVPINSHNCHIKLEFIIFLQVQVCR